MSAAAVLPSQMGSTFNNNPQMLTNAQKLEHFTKVFTASSKGDLYENSAQSLGAGMNEAGIASGPHYEVPNLSSMLYEFTNKEQDRVMQGFRIGNFVGLRDLPVRLQAGEVINSQVNKIEGNLYGPMEKRGAHVKTYVELSSAGGYFSKFEWRPEPFGLFLEQQRSEAKEKKEKQLTVHGEKPFYSHPKIQILPRHISSFQTAKGPDLQAASSFYGEDDPYEATKFEILREKWLSDSKILYGEFKPAHNLQGLKQVNKQHLPEIVGLIKRHLLADWSDINFVIGTNPEDFIEMRFDSTSLDSPKGLHAYLNNLINSHEMVLKYQLRRVSEYWGIFGEEGIYIYYMLAPPWQRMRNPTLYLKQIQGVSGGVGSQQKQMQEIQE